MPLTYTPIAASETDIDAPITTSLMARLRDNPIATAAQLSGSPTTRGALLLENANVSFADTINDTGGSPVACTSWDARLRNGENQDPLLPVMGDDFVFYEFEILITGEAAKDQGARLRLYGSNTLQDFGYSSSPGLSGYDAINLDMRTNPGGGAVAHAHARGFVMRAPGVAAVLPVGAEVFDMNGASSPRAFSAVGYRSNPMEISGFRVSIPGSNPPGVHLRVWGAR